MNASLTQVTIYTDGSCLGNPGAGGWSAVLIHEASGAQKSISGGEAATTNNRMELTAAIMALRELKRPVSVTIFTDSAYMLNAFTKGWLTSWQRRNWRKADGKPVENVDLWQQLLEVAQIHRLSWHKVKAHVGHKYNEMCDQLAKAEAAKFKK